MSVRTNGTSTYLTSPASSVYNALNATTVCMWVKAVTLPANAQPMLIAKDPTNTESPAFFLNNIFTSPNSFGAFVGDSFQTYYESDSPNNAITSGVWFNLAMSYDMVAGGAIKLYINGVQTGNGDVIPPGSIPINDSRDGYWIGYDNGTGFLNGEISDLRVYNTQLSGSQIASIAAGGTPASANLVAWWKFCANSLLVDSSGNGNTLTNFGAIAGATQPPVDICNPAPAPPSAGTISGNVVISGAEVQCVSDHFDSSKTLIRFTISDAQGNYSFSGLPIGNYYLEAFAPGFVYRRRVLAVVDGVNANTDINLVPTPVNSWNGS
jgi:hypothetical protein